MALLYEIAEYSLNQLTEVPREKACTSVLRKWGVPGNKEVVKETVMKTTLTSSDQKKGIPPTLYDARLNFKQIKNVPFMLKLKSQLCKIDKNIGFAHVIPDTPAFDDNSLTKYGLQLLGSPLNYQLAPIDINFSILPNLDNLPNLYDNTMEQDFPESLPVTTLDWYLNICEHGSVSKHEFFQKLKVTHTESQSIEKRTRKQRESKEWKEYRKNRLTSTSAHKILIRKKYFDTYKQLDKPFNEQIESVKQALDHGIWNEALAIEKYRFIMNYKINRPVKIREAGIIIQSQLFWLGASPDGVIFDKKIQEIG